MIKGIRHYGICVYDEKRALRFYQDILGLELVCKKYLRGKFPKKLLGFSKLKYIKLRCKKTNDYIELYVLNYCPHITTFNHIALSVHNLDKLYNRCINSDVFFYSKPLLDPQKKNKIVFCKDYDGNLIELVEVLK